MAQMDAKRQQTQERYDAVVIGAGFAGLNVIKVLRETLNVLAIEAGEGVGGTWYWNRYPGARCDVESVEYSYTFDKELFAEWNWTQRYPEQEEIERYANWVADKYDLRRHIRFGTRVLSATYEDEGARWSLRTDRGETITCNYLICATGALSVHQVPKFAGLDSFEGQWYHTAAWPREGVDFEGKRVAVVGTGSSGIQSIPVIAEQAGNLTVFQRTANYSIPAGQAEIDQEMLAERKRNLEAWREETWKWPGGHPVPTTGKSVLDFSKEEAHAILERVWGVASCAGFSLTFTDVTTSEKANDVVAEFARLKIREIVKDPETAELLCPKDHPFGSKRLCVDTNYFETYNRDNVSLVSVKENPIAAITANGIRLTDGSEYEFDIIVFATGFDALTGALLRIDIRGRDGRTLKQEWKNGPRSYLGMQVAGFPNLFVVSGPGSPSVIANMMMGFEFQINWIDRCLKYLREAGAETIEASERAQDAWGDEVRRAANATLLPRGNSWWQGANIPGKPRGLMVYAGGWPAYTAKCTEVAANGYEGFEIGRRRVAASLQHA